MNSDQEKPKQTTTDAPAKPPVEETKMKKDELAEGQLDEVKGGVTNGAMA